MQLLFPEVEQVPEQLVGQICEGVELGGVADTRCTHASTLKIILTCDFLRVVLLQGVVDALSILLVHTGLFPEASAQQVNAVLSHRVVVR